MLLSTSRFLFFFYSAFFHVYFMFPSHLLPFIYSSFLLLFFFVSPHRTVLFLVSLLSIRAAVMSRHTLKNHRKEAIHMLTLVIGFVESINNIATKLGI